MSTTKINVSGVMDQSAQLSRAKNHISSAKDDVAVASGRIIAQIQGRNNIKTRLDSVQKQLASLEVEIDQLKSVTEKGAASYQSTDNSVCSWQNDLRASASRITNFGSLSQNSKRFH